MQTYRLAPMSRGIRILTWLLMLIPAGMLWATFAVMPQFFAPFLIVCLIYAWVWLRFRPTAFVIHQDSLEVIWPWKRRRIARAGIREARLMTVAELQREIGWGLRIGAGGMWGGFGWLWTRKRGIVQMYVSRTDGFVWIERGDERPWLITPERPQDFVQALARGEDARH